jgi:DnaK suppressor protein
MTRKDQKKRFFDWQLPLTTLTLSVPMGQKSKIKTKDKKATVSKVKSKTIDAKAKPEPKVVLEKAFIERQKERLLQLRDHFLDQMQGVAQDNLRSRAEGSEASAFGMHQADAGSDAYEKDFALSLLSQEQDALYEIEEALKRVELNTYGTCEMSAKAIPQTRLEAIPFARFTVECQQQLEKENRGRRRWDTAPQLMDSAEAFADDDDDSGEEEERKKEKE